VARVGFKVRRRIHGNQIITARAALGQVKVLEASFGNAVQGAVHLAVATRFALVRRPVLAAYEVAKGRLERGKAGEVKREPVALDNRREDCRRSASARSPIFFI